MLRVPLHSWKKGGIKVVVVDKETKTRKWLEMDRFYLDTGHLIGD